MLMVLEYVAQGCFIYFLLFIQNIFWLVEITRIFLHFDVISSIWRIIEPRPRKPGGKVELFWLFEQNGGTVGQNIVLVLRQNIVYDQREVNTMDNICYLEYICRSLSAKFPVKEALSIWK